MNPIPRDGTVPDDVLQWSEDQLRTYLPQTGLGYVQNHKKGLEDNRFNPRHAMLAVAAIAALATAIMASESPKSSGPTPPAPTTQK